MNATNYVKPEYPMSALTGQIIGAAQEVHRQLGLGFREIIYQRALHCELIQRGLDASREQWIDVLYKGEKIGKQRVDFIVADLTGSVIIEIKAKKLLEDVDFIQTLSYLKAARYQVGLLINFGGKALVTRRLINTKGAVVVDRC